MSTKPPPDRRKFASEWDEIGYLCDKLLYWFYRSENPGKARPYADRLEQLLPKASPDHEAIFGEECWSLVHELKGDLWKAIEHRENEIRLIRRLQQLSHDAPFRDVALKNYDCGDLSDRLDLLATLYHAGGQLDKAIAVLQESKQLCKTHRVSFAGEEILREYLDEKRHSQKGRRTGVGAH